ncbi:iron hydrogenase [Tritrichomonas foetus]|uniref:Iron hydrogenase n=1 Tax=Tritrichomonas foetus TaxID=1144522 RepID=A0A1J4L5Q8_9EUKA|nr:iron hydrogenase [Tritrichomonas foetus]|eukprot:OHT17348.1 iron hydrogenase [Tritrichomonas foetus]
MLTSSFRRSAAKASPSPDFTTNSITIDRTKCVSCGMCIKACKTVAGQGVLKLAKDGDKKLVSTVSGAPLQETACIKCGQCTLVCGPGAIMEKDQISDVEKVLKNPQGKVAVCQTAPAVRINLSDALGLPAGTISTGKMVTALKMLGFQYVFDTNWSADMTIVEEASELVKRLTEKDFGPLPMFTSCCPAWVNYVEQSDPSLIPNLSSCRSPMGMLSSTIRRDFASVKKIEPKDIFNVAIMPCTAKKDEIERPQLRTEDGIKETDYVITTRELMRMIKKAKIDFKKLPDTPFDQLYAESTGAGAIFCGSGGVMEAAIRTAYKLVTGKELENYNIDAVRGLDGIKIATVDFDGTPVTVAVAQGVANAKKLIKKIRDGDADVKDVKFVEVMACPGGCVCGGGSTRAKTKKAIEKRVEAVYRIDKESTKRASHLNAELNECYDRFLDGHYFSHKAHHVLHTKLAPRNAK